MGAENPSVRIVCAPTGKSVGISVCAPTGKPIGSDFSFPQNGGRPGWGINPINHDKFADRIIQYEGT
jgi:hypothetical protein